MSQSPNTANGNGNSNGNSNSNNSNGTPSPALQNGERRSSFGFMRRQKSTEAASKMNKKQKALAAQEQERQTKLQQRVPPVLPNIDNNIASFGGENGRQTVHSQFTNNNSYKSGPHAMPMQSQNYPKSHVGSPISSSSPASKNGDHVDPYARTESMQHRGRYSYASSAVSITGINSPRRVRRRKDPTPFK